MTEPRYWIIESIAAPEDPNWLDTRRWNHIVVAASSPAEARLSAQKMDRRLAREDHTVEQYEAGRGLEDSKLYAVRPLSEDEAAAIENTPDEDGVLSAELDERQPRPLEGE
jgi:uncharacterized membrane-anchored protein